MAYTSTNANNIQLGTCSVTFGSTDLGLTKGGVEVNVATQTYKITVDQFGSTEVNEYITGRTAMVTCPLAETDITKLLLVLPGAAIVTDATTNTHKKLTVPNSTGVSLLSYAQALVLHPVALGSTARNYDFSLPSCAPKGDFQFAYKIDEERIYKVEFSAYPDLSTGLVYVIGDATATA